MAMMLTDKDFEAKVLKSAKPVMVDFFAEWCGPCKMAGPIIEELSQEYKEKLDIGKVDVDANKEYSGKYGVMSIPTVIMFKDGEEVDRMTGFKGKEGYEEMIKKVLGV